MVKFDVTWAHSGTEFCICSQGKGLPMLTHIQWILWIFLDWNCCFKAMKINNNAHTLFTNVSKENVVVGCRTHRNGRMHVLVQSWTFCDCSWYCSQCHSAFLDTLSHFCHRKFSNDGTGRKQGFLISGTLGQLVFIWTLYWIFSNSLYIRILCSIVLNADIHFNVVILCSLLNDVFFLPRRNQFTRLSDEITFLLCVSDKVYVSDDMSEETFAFGVHLSPTLERVCLGLNFRRCIYFDSIEPLVSVGMAWLDIETGYLLELSAISTFFSCLNIYSNVDSLFHINLA